MGGLYTGWVGVLAILKIDFARTITLGENIGQKLFVPAQRFIPIIEDVVPPEHRKWVPISVRWFCKGIAITVAWWIQRVISAFHSAIRGGLMFSEYLVAFLREKDMLSKDTKHLDEAIGWGVALVGFLFQLYMRFGMPFPFNVLLLPVRIIEGMIVWSVNYA